MPHHLDIACFGHATLDIRYFIERFPNENRGTHIKEVCTVLGGDAAIIASNLALMGLRVGLIGNGVGRDKNGKKIRSLLRERGIKISLDDYYKNSSYIIVFVAERGSRTWFANGMERYLKRDPETYDMGMLTQSKIVYIDSWFQEAALRAIHIAREVNKTIVLHAGPWTPDSFLKNVQIVVRSLSDYQQTLPENLIRHDLDTGVDLAVVTQGENGCSFGTVNGIAQVRGHRVKVIDTTGAGATFTSGIIYGFLKGHTLDSLSAFGNALAAMKVSVFGNLSEINTDYLMQLSKK